MQWNVLEKIAGDLLEMGYRGRIHPYGNGEPLTDPAFLKRIKYLKGKLPKSFFYVSTNGDFLEKAFSIMEIWESGVNYIQCNHYDEKNIYLKNYPTSAKIKMNGNYYHMAIGHEDIGKLRMEFYNRAGNIKVQSITAMENCWWPGKKIYINYRGDVLICCSDWKYDDPLGNVMDYPLWELIESPKMKDYQDKLAKGKSDELPLCSKCNLIRHQEVV